MKPLQPWTSNDVLNIDSNSVTVIEI